MNVRNLLRRDHESRADRTSVPGLLHRMDSYRRPANYLSVRQSYLYDNPLLKKPLKLSHVKPIVVGHWSTTPGHAGNPELDLG